MDERKFPSRSLVPKAETGVLNFLKKYPEYNGDGVTIAIFDSGVDPKATGLQITPNDETKIIERYDCSGCGDVDISKKVTATADNTIIGLSGKTLKISQSMAANNVNPNEYRVGIKSIYDMYPTKIREKVLSRMKEKKFTEPHKLAVANGWRELNAFESKITVASSSMTTSNDINQQTLKDKLSKESLENSLEFLNNFEKKFAEINPTYDCIVYQTKEHWIAVIDTTEQGDLENALHLGEYTKTHDIKSVDDILSVSVNVYEKDNVLEVVGMCSSHGTHVASIAAGNHCENTECCGVAPAAKIVSMTIGDNRLGSMETGTALARAIIKVMELCESGRRVHVVNMSYGEHAHWSHTGRIGSLMTEMVNKYGVVYVISAGNHGPALGTIGSPPDIDNLFAIGVGAYVSPEMMEAGYALRQKLPANVYTWSSRDPCIDGGQGVTICAPGCAIASVPEFTLNKQMLMNGTSMAAPHAAGAVALLISGLQKMGSSYSPYSIKRALWNTATKLSYVDFFAQGNGLLNVEKAFEHLVQYKDETENDIRFDVKVGIAKTKGIHIREGIIKSREYSVNIEPVFLNDKDVDAKKKINFNVRVTLIPSDNWIQCGSFLDLCYGSRAITVKVDPTNLPIGVHSASVRAFDSANIGKGILFEIPITVVVPTVILDTTKTKTVTFDTILYKPNTIVRHFIYVPANATWAVLKMKTTDNSSLIPGKFFIHTMQILPKKFCKALETQKIYSVTGDDWTINAFKCQPENTLEICIAKYWTCLGDFQLEANVEFFGVSSNGQNNMLATNGIQRMDVKSLGPEEIQPLITLKSAVLVLKPTESKISPLSHRDIVPPHRQIYQNILTYNIQMAKNYEISLHAQLLSHVLYESAFESQLWMLFDGNKMMIGCGDAYSSRNNIKLTKGEYVIKLQVRHEKRELLEKVNDLLFHVTYKLTNTLSPDIFSTYNGAIIGDKKIQSLHMNGNGKMPLFVAPISVDKLTKNDFPNQCSWLNGHVVYTKNDIGRKVDLQLFRYILADCLHFKKNNNNGNVTGGGGVGSKETKNKFDEYKEGLRDFKNGQIMKLDLEQAEKVYQEIVDEFPDFLPVHMPLIQKLELIDTKSAIQWPFTYKTSIHKFSNLENIKNNLKRSQELANLIINGIDVGALLTFYGLKTDTRSDALKIKSTMDKQKMLLIDAYTKKAVSLSKLHLIESISDKDTDITSVLDEVDKIYNEIGKFIDYNDAKINVFTLWHGFMHKHYGRMIKILYKQFEEKPQKDILDELRLVVGAQNWTHISYAIEKMLISNYPNDYRLF